MNKTKKRFILALCGLAWPFFVAAVHVIIHIHIKAVPAWYSWYIALPVMAMGLIPVLVLIVHLLPGRLPAWFRWPVGMIITAAIGWGVYILIICFVFWFHIAIGGNW